MATTTCDRTGTSPGIETVLLVDDEPAIRRLLCRTLEEAGYATLNVPTGTAALQVAEKYKPPIHLLLTDIAMPEMDGFELASKIGMHHPETRVLLVSGHADDRLDIRKRLGHTPHPFLLKPFARDTLSQKVRRVLTVAVPRFVQALPVRYRAEEESEWQPGMTVNISESGLLLDAAKPVALEARLELTFELPERLGRLNAGPVTCLGRVVRHGAPTRSTPYLLGLQFIAGAGPRAGDRAQSHGLAESGDFPALVLEDRRRADTPGRHPPVRIDLFGAAGGRRSSVVRALERVSMAGASVVSIVAEDEVQVVKSEPGFETDIRVFADTDAIKARQLITRDRPRLVVLERAFIDTERGAALVNAIRTDQTLADTQIRVLAQAGDYVYLVSRRAEAGFAPGTAVPGEPLPADYLGTRQARRFRMDAAMRVRLGGTSITLVDLSRTGAYVVGPIALRPHQRVDLLLVDSEQDLKIIVSVVWVFFEPTRGDATSRYRAGVKFIDTDPEIIEAFSVRHRQN